jgi:hypothetical protein
MVWSWMSEKLALTVVEEKKLEHLLELVYDKFLWSFEKGNDVALDVLGGLGSVRL